MGSINKRPVSFVVRPHPHKNKPLVRPCFSAKQILEALKQPQAREIKNVSSGEDAYV